MISKGFLYHLVCVKDFSIESPSFQFILIINEFPEFFHEDIHKFPTDRSIDFWFDHLPNTRPVSIPPYRIVPAELKELKEKLKDLLGKGLMYSSVSPWGAPVFFVHKKDEYVRM